MSLAVSLATLEREIGGDGSGDSESTACTTLRLAFLGCEVLPPYGPYEHTANLFCDLIANAWSRTDIQQGKLVVEVFGASKDDYQLPSLDQLSTFDGVILPGSFSSAYNTDPWILRLGDWIQNVLVEHQIPTLGVCFGHQLYAHSFSNAGGKATKCPAGPQAGQRTTKLTPMGMEVLDKNATGGLDLLYTHGDMVQSLPPTGVSLGGTAAVPIQSAVYFSSTPEGNDPETWIPNHKSSTASTTTDSSQKVIAVTFQAHPEFASGETNNYYNQGRDTFTKTVDLMNQNGDLSQADREAALTDAESNYTRITQQSLQAMVEAGKLLGWFE